MNSHPSSSDRRPIAVALALSTLLSLPIASHGAVTLTGLLHQGAEPDGTTAGSPILNTLGNELNYANIYVTQPNSGPYASFINHGNASGASIAYGLTPGIYTFYFFSEAFYPANYREQYGLNLFFDGNPMTPGITAFGPSETVSANASPAGPLTYSLSGDPSDRVPSPGTLIYTTDELSVTLTGYGFGRTGSFLISPIDRVGNLNDSPDGLQDGIGTFTLEVAVIPEPSLACIGVLAAMGLLVSRRRRGPASSVANKCR